MFLLPDRILLACGVTLVGCWAHARRKYDEAIKGAPPETNKLASVSGQGLAFYFSLQKA